MAIATAPWIGTLRERPLHAALKRWYALPGDRAEHAVDGYVIDLVRDNVNIGNVDAVEALDDADKQWLHDVVRRHQEESGSTVAEKLLAEWDVAVERFSKIIPSTYKAVLAAKAAAEQAGLSETEITEKMMEAATNG